MAQSPKKPAQEKKPATPSSGGKKRPPAVRKPHVPKPQASKARAAKAKAHSAPQPVAKLAAKAETPKPAAKAETPQPAAKAETPQPAAKAETPKAAADSPQPAKGGGGSGWVWLVVVLAVAAGAAYATRPMWTPYVQAYLPAAKEEPVSDPRIDAVAEQLKTLEGRAVTQAASDQVIKKMEEERARFSERLGALMEKVDSLDQALQSVRKMAKATAPPLDVVNTNASLQQLSERFARMEERGEVIEGLLERINDLEQTRVTAETPIPPEPASGDVDKTETTAPAPQPGTREIVLAASRMREALRGDSPFTESLRAFKEAAGDHDEIIKEVAGLDPYAASGIPTLVSLRERFDGVVEKVLNASKPQGGDGWIEKTLSKLATLVSVRRIGGDAGENPVDAALSNAETSFENGDFINAVKALEGLTGAPAEAAAPWLKDAQARMAAERTMAALHVLTVSLLTPVKE